MPSCPKIWRSKHSNYDSLSTTSVEKDSNTSSQSTSPEPHPTDRERWKSIIISLLVIIMIMGQNAMYFSNLWPYMKQIDPSTNQSFYGVALMVAGLSLAFSSPIYGWWSSKIQNCRKPLYCGITLVLAGNVLVGLAESFPSNRKYVLMAGRVINGIGCGCYAPMFAYVIMATTVDERRKAVSLRAALITVAMFLGPVIASAFVPIGFPGKILGGWLHLDMYSSIAWLNVGVCITLYFIVGCFFKEYWIALDESETNKGGSKKTAVVGSMGDNPNVVSRLRPYDKVPVFVCWYLRFAFMFMINVDRAIGTAMIMIMFKWSPGEAITYSAIIQLAIGVMDFSGNLIMGNIVLKYFKERTVMVFGISIALGYFFFSFPWPGQQPIVDPIQDFDKFHNNISQMRSTESLLTTLASYGNSTTSPSQKDLTECNYDWCRYTTRLQLWQYVAGRFFLALSISTGFTPTSTLMSKVIGPRKQGTMQGLYAAFGQIGTTISPLIMGTTFQYYGPRVSFGIGAAINISALILVIVTFKRLVGWRDYSEEERKRLFRQPSETAPLIDDIDRRDSLLYGC